MKKTIMIMAAAALCAGLLSSCGGSDSTPKPRIDSNFNFSKTYDIKGETDAVVTFTAPGGFQSLTVDFSFPQGYGALLSNRWGLKTDVNSTSTQLDLLNDRNATTAMHLSSTSPDGMEILSVDPMPMLVAITYSMVTSGDFSFTYNVTDKEGQKASKTAKYIYASPPLITPASPSYQFPTSKNKVVSNYKVDAAAGLTGLVLVVESSSENFMQGIEFKGATNGRIDLGEGASVFAIVKEGKIYGKKSVNVDISGLLKEFLDYSASFAPGTTLTVRFDATDDYGRSTAGEDTFTYVYPGA